MGEGRALPTIAAGLLLAACASDDRAGRGDAPTARRTLAYHCAGGERLEALVTGSDNLRLIPPGRHAVGTTRVRSASGARYRGGGLEFWDKGATALYSPASGARVECRRLDARASWAEAAAEGARFRALGQEPGWLVTVTNGRLRAELDYGQRTVSADVARRRAGTASAVWAGDAPGAAVRLVARNAPCRDSMNGQAFPLTVRLEIASSTYRGCGRWLVPR